MWPSFVQFLLSSIGFEFAASTSYCGAWTYKASGLLSNMSFASLHFLFLTETESFFASYLLIPWAILQCLPCLLNLPLRHLPYHLTAVLLRHRRYRMKSISFGAYGWITPMLASSRPISAFHLLTTVICLLPCVTGSLHLMASLPWWQYQVLQIERETGSVSFPMRFPPLILVLSQTARF